MVKRPTCSGAGLRLYYSRFGRDDECDGERDDLPGGGPQKAGLAFADLTTGLYAAIAIQAALLSRVSTGQGQHIDMALLDTQVASLSVLAMNYLTSEKYRAVWVMRTQILYRIRYLKPLKANLLLHVAMTNSLRPYVKVSSVQSWL